MNLKIWLGLLGFGFFMLTACTKADQKKELIVGNWMLERATRQGKPTSTLEGLNFTFTDDSIYTNLPVFENYLYTYAKDTLIVHADDPFSFYVLYVDSTQLDLQGEIKRVPFHLVFGKVKP